MAFQCLLSVLCLLYYNCHTVQGYQLEYRIHRNNTIIQTTKSLACIVCRTAMRSNASDDRNYMVRHIRAIIRLQTSTISLIKCSAFDGIASNCSMNP
eukprot:135823_1